MKSYSLQELKQHVKEFEPLLGAQLQDIETHAKGLAFSLYKKGRIWWILDLTQQAPLSVVLFEESPWKKKITPKPVALFLNSHAKNLYLSKVTLIEGAGRVMVVDWVGTGRFVRMEIHLIPKAVNVIVQTGDKSISWAKPKDLAPAPQVEGLFRDLLEIKSEWLSEQGIKSAEGPFKTDKPDEKRLKDLAKKKKALDELEKHLRSDEMEKWKTLGELLKSFEPSELGSEWKEFLKFSNNRVELMQHCFEKAKQLERKKAGTLERLEILKKEVSSLESGESLEKPKVLRSQLKEAGAEGRTKRLGDFVVSRGKNAQDNLALLRAAKAWDLWIHLRDYPSSHVILALQKNQKAPDSILREAAIWLAQETIKSKSLLSGSRLDIVVAECRFVKPIKGDKLGRVHYQNERVLTVTLP